MLFTSGPDMGPVTGTLPLNKEGQMPLDDEGSRLPPRAETNSARDRFRPRFQR